MSAWLSQLLTGYGLRCSLIVLLATALLACASEEERFAEHSARAAASRQEGRLEDAIIELRLALEIKPEDPVTNYSLAEVYRDARQFENALFFFREAQRLDPQWIEPLLGEFPLILAIDSERASEIVRRLLELAADDPRTQRILAEQSLIAANTEKALEAALTAVALDPDDPENHLAVGRVYQAKMREQRIAKQPVSEEDFRSALDAFERAEAGGSSLTTLNARLERARTLASTLEHKNQAEALFDSALELAVEIDSSSHQLLIAEDIALRARRANDLARERQALETIVALDPERFSEAEVWALGNVDGRIRSAWVTLANLRERESPGEGLNVLKRLIDERPDDPQSHVIYAQMLHASGQSQEALDHLESNADRGVAPAVLLEAAVRLALAGGEREVASRQVERLRAEHPDDPHALLASARLSLARRRIAEAVETLGRVNELAESEDSQHLLALAQLELGNLAEAQHALSRALEFNPMSRASLRLQARIYSQEGDWTAVVRTLRRLFATSAERGTGDQLLLIRALYELEREQAALALLEQLLAETPPPQAAIIAFLRFEGARRPERSTQLIDEALARNPRSVALLSAGAGFDARAGRIDRALERLDRGLESMPDQPALLALRAQMLVRANRLEEAERDAREAFERNPTMPRLLELLVAIYQRQGRTDAAIEQLEASERTRALGPQHRMLLGRLQMGNGNTDRAAELYEAALEENPELAGAKNDLAYLLAREGRDLERALELAREARQALGEEPQVLDTLGFVMLKRGLAGPATEQFSAAMRIAAETGQASPVYHYHMGLALRALGQEEAAAEHLERALSLGPDFPEATDARQQLEAARAAVGSSDAPAS